MLDRVGRRSLVIAKLINKVDDAIIVEEIGSKNLARISHPPSVFLSAFPSMKFIAFRIGRRERLERSLLALASGDFRSLRLVKWPSRGDFQAENARV